MASRRTDSSRAVFKLYDSSRSGLMSIVDFRNYLFENGCKEPTTDAVLRLFMEADRDCDNRLSAREFARAVAKLEQPGALERLDAAGLGDAARALFSRACERAADLGVSRSVEVPGWARASCSVRGAPGVRELLDIDSLATGSIEPSGGDRSPGHPAPEQGLDLYRFSLWAWSSGLTGGSLPANKADVLFAKVRGPSAGRQLGLAEFCKVLELAAASTSVDLADLVAALRDRQLEDDQLAASGRVVGGHTGLLADAPSSPGGVPPPHPAAPLHGGSVPRASVSLGAPGHSAPAPSLKAAMLASLPAGEVGYRQACGLRGLAASRRAAARQAASDGPLTGPTLALGPAPRRAASGGPASRHAAPERPLAGPSPRGVLSPGPSGGSACTTTSEVVSSAGAGRGGVSASSIGSGAVSGGCSTPGWLPSASGTPTSRLRGPGSSPAGGKGEPRERRAGRSPASSSPISASGRARAPATVTLPIRLQAALLDAFSRHATFGARRDARRGILMRGGQFSRAFREAGLEDALGRPLPRSACDLAFTKACRDAGAAQLRFEDFVLAVAAVAEGAGLDVEMVAGRFAVGGGVGGSETPGGSGSPSGGDSPMAGHLAELHVLDLHTQRASLNSLASGPADAGGEVADAPNGLDLPTPAAEAAGWLARSRDSLLA